MAVAAILNFSNYAFTTSRYVPNRSPNVSINFGDDGSNTKEMAAVFGIPDDSSRHLEKYTSG